ncbi:MAG: hypothetical protein JSW39_16755 [Desulfobacterales bacterium]|nr:MAG: hypothetical protein JSW39_16755 [Desulfobacterales bacterium]
MKKLICVLIPFIITACASRINGGGGLYESSTHHFAVDIPAGWVQLNTDKYLMLSKEDPFLQYVLIQARPIDKPFKHTRKKLKPRMLPQEAAEIILDEISSDRNVVNFALVENIPVSLDGYDAFKVIFTYSTENSLNLKTIYYGLLSQERFYNIRYTAVEKYYFKRDIEAFEAILNSFKLHDAPAG